MLKQLISQSKSRLAMVVICLAGSAQLAFAQTTAFTYQGKLTDAGNPANGTYDLQFRLFDALTGGNQVGAPVVREDVPVTSGIFTVTLDFGAAAFPGAHRWLEIAVRLGTSTGGFTALSPLQPITATPYAVQSLNAANATNATNATNANTAADFSGALGGDVTGTQGATTVSKLQGRSVANTAPLTGQVLKFNSTTNQWAPDTDNISGGGGGGTITGVAAGTGLSGGGASGNVTLNIANGGVGTTQLADNGVTDAKINSVSGSKVTGAVANATNAANATTATNATNATTAVNFSGALGGDVTGNQSATTVAKLRNVSLPAPVLADHGKVLKYKNNGVDPISFEWAADNNSGGTLTNVTASAPLASSGGATPNLALTGVVAAANGGTGLSAVGAAGNLLRSNGAAWTSAALQAADVPDLGASYLKNTTTQQAGSNFNISGNGTAGGILAAGTVNATTQYNLGGNRILSNPGTDNLFAGVNAGAANTTGGFNSFFGKDAGLNNTTGGTNSFFGTYAGLSNKGGGLNSFFGVQAGYYNTDGFDNSFFGTSAGGNNTNGDDNSFFGRQAGFNNTTGGFNSSFGRSAGDANTTGIYNTTIGALANVGSSNLQNATAIGAGAVVNTSAKVQIGRVGLDKVAIGAFANPSTSTAVCINALGEFTACASSLRYKESVQPLRQGLHLIQRLRPVTFNWKEGHTPDLGLIAEEVAEVEPLLNTYNHKGEIEGVKYTQLTVVLINAVKEQQTQLEAQAKQIATQQAALKRQQQQLDALKQLVCQANPQAAACQE